MSCTLCTTPFISSIDPAVSPEECLTCFTCRSRETVHVCQAQQHWPMLRCCSLRILGAFYTHIPTLPTTGVSVTSAPNLFCCFNLSCPDPYNFSRFFPFQVGYSTSKKLYQTRFTRTSMATTRKAHNVSQDDQDQLLPLEKVIPLVF